MTSFAIVSIGSLLQNAVEKYNTDGTLKTLPWKAGVSSLFKQSLKVVQWRDTQVVDNSVNVVLDKIVEQAPSCSTAITKADIINVLYYTDNYGSLATSIPFGIGNGAIYARDASFRRIIDQTIAKDASIKVPTVQERNTSCIKITYCMNNIQIKEDVSLNTNTQQKCENTVRDAYMSAMLTNRSVSLITEWSFGENIFQNGTLDDSDYDLMDDIYRIGTLLFQSYIPPVELVYYQLPTAGQWSNGSNTNTPGTPWYIPPSNVVGPVVSTTTPWAQSSYTPGMFDVWWVSVSPAGNNGWSTTTVWWSTPDTPIDDTFIDQTNTSITDQLPLPSSPEVIIWSNICIVADDPIVAMADQPVDTITFEEYQWLLDDYYALLDEQEIINQLISEDEDISISAPAYDPSDPTSVQTYQDEIQSLEQEIVDIVSNTFDVTKDPNDPTINSCLADCDGLPKLDYAICTAKCLCGEVWSAAVSNNGFEIIKKDAFKIKFCQIPASPTSVKRNRSIYSIEEIFDEMRNIFVSLKSSGELFKHVRTKEFLDSSVKKNKFGQMFSFNIQVGVKSTKDQASANNYKIQQEEANQKLESTLLNQASNLAPTTERNKYIIIANPALTKAALQSDGTVADLTQRLTWEVAFLESAKKVLDGASVNDTQIAKNNMVNSQVTEFFAANFKFRDQVIQSFTDFNGIAESLKTKAQKAK